MRQKREVLGFFDLNFGMLAVPGLPFLTRDLVTLNNTLSILHIPCPLVAGPI